ncbi:MAG: ABC transporter permease [Planctomycetes bacterium]|nr:ABC transporter permease [Planctomycetota bacterium]
MSSESRNQLILESGRADRQYWKDLWTFRELLFQLVRRDVSVHYKQTVIGAAWAVVRPLVTVVILTMVFSRVAKLNADGGIWYPLYVLVGMTAWQLFASVLGESSNSLVANANLVSKVYFPRMLVPLSTIGVPLVDLAVMVPILAVMMAIGGVVPQWRVIFAPIFLLLALAAAIGLGLVLSSLNVKYRDVRYVIPFVLQFGVYISPIGYPTSRVPAEYQLAYHLNPMVLAIDGMRWSLLGVGNPFAGGAWLVSVAVTLAALYAGVQYFRRTEKNFADVI